MGGLWKSISLGLHNRFVNQALPMLHKVSGKQGTAPLPPYIDTQSSESKLEQYATWRHHRVRDEDIFIVPCNGLSGLRPTVTEAAHLPGQSPWGPCQHFLRETPWSLSGSFRAHNFFLFCLYHEHEVRGELSCGVRRRNAGQLRARSAGTVQGDLSSSAGIISSLVQEKVKAWADNREPRVAATGSLTLNFWTPYSMKLCIIPSLAPWDVCERCSHEYSSSPTGETLCYEKIAAFSPYLWGSWWRAWRQSGNSDGSHFAPARAAYQQNAGADSRRDYLITYLLH